jgi:hypothetical protein
MERPETHRGNISWYIYENINQNWVKDLWEKGMAGWKVILAKLQDPVCKEDNKKDEKDKNNRNDHDHDDRDDRKDNSYNREICAITDKKWYYRFTNLSSWTYSVSIEPQKNWSILKPQNNIYNLTLSSWQNIINLNFETTFLKGKNK